VVIKVPIKRFLHHCFLDAIVLVLKNVYEVDFQFNEKFGVVLLLQKLKTSNEKYKNIFRYEPL